MLIIGTGGLASDILSSIQFDESFDDLCFYNDTEIKAKDYIKNNYRILTSISEAKDYFKNNDNRFIVGIGDNITREKISKKFENLGGINSNYISSQALVGKYTIIDKIGVIILHHAAIGNGCSIGRGSIVYTNASLGHGSIIGEYVLVSGNVCMSDTTIGKFSTIGIGASFKPGVIIAGYSFVGVGSVVTKNIDTSYLIAGNPGRAIKKIVSQENL